MIYTLHIINDIYIYINNTKQIWVNRKRFTTKFYVVYNNLLTEYYSCKTSNQVMTRWCISEIIVTDGVARWYSACPRPEKSAVQASATASCSGGELFTYI